MIKNYMYSDAAGTDVVATEVDGYFVFTGGTSVEIQNIKKSDVLSVSSAALVAANTIFDVTFDVGGTPAEGDIVTITIQSQDSRQNRRDVYKVYVHSGDTVSSIAAELAAQINADNTSAVAVANATAGEVRITSATEQLTITVGAQGASTITLELSAPAPQNFVSATSPAYFAEKDGVVLGADATYAALYMRVRKHNDQTYIGGGFEEDLVAVYAPQAEVTAMLGVVDTL
jgi:hypothetical protein